LRELTDHNLCVVVGEKPQRLEQWVEKLNASPVAFGALISAHAREQM